MLSQRVVIGVNAALAVLWIVAIALAASDGGRAVASFLAAVHGSLAVVGLRGDRDDDEGDDVSGDGGVLGDDPPDGGADGVQT